MKRSSPCPYRKSEQEVGLALCSLPRTIWDCRSCCLRLKRGLWGGVLFSGQFFPRPFPCSARHYWAWFSHLPFLTTLQEVFWFTISTILIQPEVFDEISWSCLSAGMLSTPRARIWSTVPSFATFLLRPSSVSIRWALQETLPFFFSVLWKLTSPSHQNCKPCSPRTPSFPHPFPAPYHHFHPLRCPTGNDHGNFLPTVTAEVTNREYVISKE